MADEKLDEFSAHEALDRAAMVTSIFEDWVHQHPFVQADPALKSMADHALKAASDLHQAIGAKALG